MPLYDFQCRDCKEIFERFAKQEDRSRLCNKCGGVSKRIVSIGRSAYREDAPWLESVLDVVDKSDKDPATQAFLSQPNRNNYHAWMKAKGIRPMSENEFRHPFRERAEKEILHRRTNLLLKQKRIRETINLRSK
jgi:putative FmdB family regulatory protein